MDDSVGHHGHDAHGIIMIMVSMVSMVDPLDHDDNGHHDHHDDHDDHDHLSSLFNLAKFSCSLVERRARKEGPCLLSGRQPMLKLHCSSTEGLRNSLWNHLESCRIFSNL